MVSLRVVVALVLAVVLLASSTAVYAEAIGPACWRLSVSSGAAPAIPPRFSLLFLTDPASTTTATVGYCVGGYGGCDTGRALTWTSISCSEF
jgi:hypothetical protein